MSQPRPQKVLVVYGTRPELIKLAPVVFALRDRPRDFELTVCSTAQHREMVDQMAAVFGIRPDHDLDLMRPNQTLNELATRALSALDATLRSIRPDWVLVQGDTTTVLATALASFHLGIRVAHVEAGLRTGDLAAPFPEEANRCLTDVLADLLFSPTALARRRLLEEGRDPSRVFLTGNTVVDALQWIARSLPDEPSADEVLITVHRRESFGEPLIGIFSALRELAQRFPHIEWIYPVHRNPNVLEPARQQLGRLDNLRLLEPLPYDELIRHLRRARIVLTDSGGIQEEAPTFKKPVLVLRDKTERPEGVEAGISRLVGTDPAVIVEQASRLLEDEAAYRSMSCRSNPYGDGRAAERIASILAGESPAPLEVEAAGVGTPRQARAAPKAAHGHRE